MMKNIILTLVFLWGVMVQAQPMNNVTGFIFNGKAIKTSDTVHLKEPYIYPNPTKTDGYITIAPSKPGDVVFIYEPSGILVKEIVMGKTKRFSTLDLESGEYFIRLNLLTFKLTVL